MITWKFNFGLAFAAVVGPPWLTFLEEISPALALILQCLGIALALLQIVKLLRDWKKPKS